MVTITTKHDDDSTLDFLATECEYEVVISEMDGAVNSALCEDGEQVREVIDKNNLLADNDIPFPTVMSFIHTISNKIPKIGL